MVPTTEKVWDEFNAELKHFILKRVPDEPGAEDILQDVFLKIHTHIDTLRESDKLQSWIYQIARNAITDYFRTYKPTPDIPEMSYMPEDPFDDVVSDLLPYVRELVDSLPPDYRQALILTEYEGLTQRARAERRLSAHRKSLHGRLVNELVRMGNHLRIEQTSYKGWQKQFGRSVAFSAPGMFVDHLKRTVAKTGGILDEVSTSQTKLSQYCHGCHCYVKKTLSQRWHHCACGIGPVQRDLYSAFLLAYLEPPETIPSIAHDEWEGADLRLAAAVEILKQRAKEGQSLPRSFGIPGARARRPENLAPLRQELISLYRRGRLEALEREQDPLHL